MINADMEAVTVIASQAVQLHRAGIEIQQLVTELQSLRTELATLKSERENGGTTGE
jgi:hypothetical protein